MPCCCVGTDTIQKALAIAAIAIIIGAADSAFRPVVEKFDKDKNKETDLAALRAERANKGTPTPAPSKSSEATKASDAHENTPAATASSDGKLGYEVSVAQAHELFQLGVPFLDARHEDDFEKGHVQGATRVAADEYPSRAGEFATYAPGPVVIYCSGGQCDASHNLAKLMQQAGFNTLHIMTDGYPGWQAAGFPTATGGK